MKNYRTESYFNMVISYPIPLNPCKFTHNLSFLLFFIMENKNVIEIYTFMIIIHVISFYTVIKDFFFINPHSFYYHFFNITIKIHHIYM